MKKKQPSCEDYLRVPLSEKVLEHIRSSNSCRTLVNALADGVNRRAYGFEHRN